MSAIYDMYMEQGDTYSEGIDVAGDYSNYTIQSSLKDSTGLVTPFTATWVDDSLGQLSLDMTSIQTSSISTGVGSYDIEVTNLSGDVTKLLKGSVYVSGEVTT